MHVLLPYVTPLKLDALLFVATSYICGPQIVDHSAINLYIRLSLRSDYYRCSVQCV